MSLIIITVSPSGSKQQLSWNIGQKLFEGKFHDLANSVVEIQADGDELDYILVHFENIPIVDNQRVVVRYFGDHAKFICANLKSY